MEVVNGVVYVTKTDGKTIQLDDSFVTKETPTGNYGPYTVPADSYFMMGDNRNHSSDSRDVTLGTVDERYVLGRAVCVLLPFQNFGMIPEGEQTR